MLKISVYLRKVISVKINPTKKKYTGVKSIIPEASLFYKACVYSNKNSDGIKWKCLIEFVFPYSLPKMAILKN